MPRLDPSAYPRTYRLRRGWRLLSLGSASGFLVGGGAMATAGVGLPGRAGLGLPFALAGGAIALLGLALAADTLRSRVVLTADAIENHGLHPTVRVRRDDVAGRRLVPSGRTRTLVLERRAPGARPFRLPLVLDTDGAFDAWLADLPDLDASGAPRRR